MIRKGFISMLVLCLLYTFAIGCFTKQAASNNALSTLMPANFNKEIEGKKVGLFVIKNGNLQAAITNYGARIVGLSVPDKQGLHEDVVVGFSSIEGYLKAKGVYHGAVIGRVAGRINQGVFMLDDRTYHLPVNSGVHHLHGGISGFHNRVWQVAFASDKALALTYLSKDGEMGYPGNLKVSVTYRLTAFDELVIDYVATTDKPTPMNLTNHAFFNLAGVGNGSINQHLLTIPADSICPINEAKIPKGNLIDVKNTPFDFAKPKAIGLGLKQEVTNDQLKIAGGYDHSFILKGKDSKAIHLAAIVLEPMSGRQMEVMTTEPTLHFFSGNFFNGSDTDKLGKPIRFRESFALETQQYPDAPNQDRFPSIILRPGKKYHSQTIFRFSVME